MLQYSEAKPPRGPILHPVEWRGVAGGGGGAFVYAQYCPALFLLAPRHCAGRGGPLATLGIMQGAAGDRGRGQLS